MSADSDSMMCQCFWMIGWDSLPRVGYLIIQSTFESDAMDLVWLTHSACETFSNRPCAFASHSLFVPSLLKASLEVSSFGSEIYIRTADATQLGYAQTPLFCLCFLWYSFEPSLLDSLETKMSKKFILCSTYSIVIFTWSLLVLI